MRDQLLGYLLGALEPFERELVEEELSRDPQLRSDLECLDRALLILKADKAHCDCPDGLATRTCEYVVTRATAISLAAARPAPAPSRWSMSDFVVAAGICMAASMLIFPAMNHSRNSARIAQCQQNLRDLGVALAGYSSAHKGYFPEVPTEGKYARAGIYGAKLMDAGWFANPTTLVCPGSELAERGDAFHVPTLAELERADGDELAGMYRTMGGSYGYNPGYADAGGYHPTKNQGRSKFAIMSDMPDLGSLSHLSLNHGGKGQNVLFEDGHVGYLAGCTAEGCNDDIFLNEQKQQQLGVHENDSVILPSDAPPIMPVGLNR